MRPFRAESGHERGADRLQQQAQKHLQLGEDEAGVIADCGGDGVGGISIAGPLGDSAPSGRRFTCD